ncbi:MAG: GGDEF domain-containing protein [Mycolicibacterium neoaurum]|uniref:GGDEF domain-containing protein n=1 Tax=Mycolicibacterium neoaurum TaxID=1795 RepID=UPI002FFB3FB2
MPSRVDLLPTAGRWHQWGAAAYLAMLALYAGAATSHDAGSAGVHQLYAVLAAAAAVAVAVLFTGHLLGLGRRRELLLGWPIAALVTTTVAGLIEPAATRDLPGTITITFAYAGLTNPPRRSLLLAPLGVLAFIVGGQHPLPAAIPKVAAAAVMWVLIAEVPAWLIARLDQQSRQLRVIALTGLLDRTTLAPQLDAHNADSAVLLIDLDGFKRYNDAHGHHAGDEVLVRFADTLRASIRTGDIGFRIGGDEFLAILVGADDDEAQRVIDRIRSRWSVAGAPVSFSAGTATGPTDLLKLADERMYQQKRLRREQRD